MTTTDLPRPPVSLPAPRLTKEMITSELGRIFAKERRSHLVAFFGTGDEATLPVNARTFTVVPTRSELDLRRRMPALLDRDDGGFVYLVDWAEQLPLDISGRLASGRLQRIDKDTRIASLYGAREVDPRLLGTALSRVVLSRPEISARLPAVSGQVLQRDDAYVRLLNALVGYPLGEDESRASFIAWCVQNGSGPTIAKVAADNEGLADELAEVVANKHGGLAAAAWQAWLTGQGEAFLHHALLVHAVLPNWGQGAYAEGVLEDRLSANDNPFGAALLAARTELGDDGLLDELLTRLNWHTTALARVEAAFDKPQLLAALGGSTYLPRGLAERQRRFAEALQDVVRNPTADNVAVARRANAEIDGHWLTRNASDTDDRKMALRLAAFLADYAAQPTLRASMVDYGPAIAAAEWYARDGGFVDWARRKLRPVREGPLAEAFGALVAAADEIRHKKDEAFGRGLPAWLEHDKPSAEIIPIEKATHKLVAGFLDGHPSRKLLVVLMDGMSAPDLAQLLESAETEERWAPIKWRPSGFSTLPSGLLPATISAMPSLTNVSRAAFFAGKADPKHGHEGTAKDEARWANNRYVRKLQDETTPPRVLLKRDVFIDGGLTNEAKDLIAPENEDTADRVVAVVVNAIDDQLKSGKQIRVRYDLDVIPMLRSLLNHASSANRAVLLIADHGHAPGTRMTSHGALKQNEVRHRWRALGPDDQPRPFEIALGNKYAWTPRGYDRVAVIWDETACYGTPRHGEHGGASLAEAVCPAVLIAAEGLADARPGDPDDGLRTTNRYEPTWWNLRVAAPISERPAPRPVKSRKPTRPTSQLAFGLGSDPDTTPEPTTADRHELVKKIAKSPVFAAQKSGRPESTVADALDHLSMLLSEGDQMGIAEFARRASVPAFRVSGPIIQLRELFNFDGASVVEHDVVGKQVRINRDLLLQLFEVKS